MQRLSTGMLVRDVRGLSVGRVQQIRSCCYEVQGARFNGNLTGDSIFDVQEGEVTLMCNEKETARYGCALHTVEP